MQELKQVATLTIIHEQIKIPLLHTNPNHRHQRRMLPDPNQSHDLPFELLYCRWVLLLDFLDGCGFAFAAADVDLAGAAAANHPVEFEVRPLNDEVGLGAEELLQGWGF
jgi:hypothetical protein